MLWFIRPAVAPVETIMADLGAATDIIVRLRMESAGIKAGLQDMLRQIDGLRASAATFGSSLGLSVGAATERIKTLSAAGDAVANALGRIPESVRFESLGARLRESLAGVGDPVQVEAIRARFEGLFRSVSDPTQLQGMGVRVREALAGVGDPAQTAELSRRFERVFAGIKTPEQLQAFGQEIQKSFGAAQTALSQTGTAAAGAETVVSRLGQGLLGMAKIAGGIALFEVFHRAAAAISELVTLGINFNAQLEQMVLGAKSVVSANIVVTDQTGRQVEGTEKLRVAGGLVAQQIEKIKLDAILTTATLGQLVEAFQVAIGPGLAAGLALDQVRQLTVALTQTAGAIGLPMQQLPIEIREILGGTISGARTRLAQVLQINNEMIASWKQQGTLFDELTSRLTPFIDAGVEAGDTWIGISSTLQDFKEQLTGAVFAPAMDVMRQFFISIRDGLGEARNGVFVFNESVLSVRDAFGAVLKGGAETFVSLVRLTRDATSAVLGAISTVATAMDKLAGKPGVGAAVAKEAVIAGIPVVRELTLAARAYEAYRRSKMTAEEREAEAAAARRASAGEEAKLAEDRQRNLQAEIGGFESGQKILESKTSSEAQLSQVVRQLGKDYQAEFLPFLTGANTNYAEAIPLIRARIAALQDQAAAEKRRQVESVKLQVEDLQLQEAAKKAEVEQRAALATAAPEDKTRADALRTSARELLAIQAERIKQQQRLQVLEQEVTVATKPRGESDPEKKARLGSELELRKSLTQALLSQNEDAQTELQAQERLFGASEAGSLQTRVALQRDFLRQRQELERRKIEIVIEGLQREAEAQLKLVPTKPEAAVEVAKLDRERLDKMADLARLRQKQAVDQELQERDFRLKRRDEDQADFEFRKRMGETSYQDEIDRQRQLAEESERGAIRARAALDTVLQKRLEIAALQAQLVEAEKANNVVLVAQIQAKINAAQGEMLTQQAVATSYDASEKKKREAAIATREKEKQLEAERASAAAGELGRLVKRLEEGELVGEGETFRKGEKRTDEQTARAIRAMNEEEIRKIGEAQAAGGLTEEERIKLGEAVQRQKSLAAKERILGPIAEQLPAFTGVRKGALSRGQLQGMMQEGILSPEEAAAYEASVRPERPPLAEAGALIPEAAKPLEPLSEAFKALPAEAKQAMNEVVETLASANADLMERAQTFKQDFPATMYENMYSWLVDRLNQEFQRG